MSPAPDYNEMMSMGRTPDGLGSQMGMEEGDALVAPSPSPIFYMAEDVDEGEQSDGGGSCNTDLAEKDMPRQALKSLSKQVRAGMALLGDITCL